MSRTVFATVMMIASIIALVIMFLMATVHSYDAAVNLYVNHTMNFWVLHSIAVFLFASFVGIFEELRNERATLELIMSGSLDWAKFAAVMTVILIMGPIVVGNFFALLSVL